MVVTAIAAIVAVDGLSVATTVGVAHGCRCGSGCVFLFRGDFLVGVRLVGCFPLLFGGNFFVGVAGVDVCCGPGGIFFLTHVRAIADWRLVMVSVCANHTGCSLIKASTSH